jgi:hypothetical protein
MELIHGTTDVLEDGITGEVGSIDLHKPSSERW